MKINIIEGVFGYKLKVNGYFINQTFGTGIIKAVIDDQYTTEYFDREYINNLLINRKANILKAINHPSIHIDGETVPYELSFN